MRKEKTYDDGRYKGQFNNGLRHGKGIFYYSNGSTSIYGQSNISSSPTVLPTGGLFKLTKYISNIFIDQYTGYLSYNSNLT